MKHTHLLLLIITLGLLPGFVKAQYGCNCSKTDAMEQFSKAKKLIVQLSGDAAYDSALVHAVEAGWKLLPYEFADEKTVESQLSNKTLAFLLPLCLYQHESVNGSIAMTTVRPNNQLTIINGGVTRLDMWDIVAYSTFDRQVPYSKNYNYKEDVKKMALLNRYRLRDAVAGINEAVEFMSKQEKGARAECIDGVKLMNSKLYNYRLPVIKTKTLYIKASDVKRGAEKISQVYPYKYKLVSDTEYEKAVTEARPDVVYLYLNHSQWGGMVLIDAAEHKCVGGVLYPGVVFIDERHIGDITEELKKIEKAKK